MEVPYILTFSLLGDFACPGLKSGVSWLLGDEDGTTLRREAFRRNLPVVVLFKYGLGAGSRLFQCVARSLRKPSDQLKIPLMPV